MGRAVTGQRLAVDYIASLTVYRKFATMDCKSSIAWMLGGQRTRTWSPSRTLRFSISYTNDSVAIYYAPYVIARR